MSKSSENFVYIFMCTFTRITEAERKQNGRSTEALHKIRREVRRGPGNRFGRSSDDLRKISSFSCLLKFRVRVCGRPASARSASSLARSGPPAHSAHSPRRPVRGLHPCGWSGRGGIGAGEIVRPWLCGC